MAKERLVNTKFWDDNYISGLPKEEKLLFIYLLTNALTNISGVYEIQDRRIIFDTGLTQGELDVAKLKFTKDGKIVFAEGWVGIVNFTKHQRPNPKVNKGILIALQSAPKSLVEKMSIDYDRLSIVYDVLSHSNTNSNSNSNSNTNSKNKRERSAERTPTPIKEKKEVVKFIKPTLDEVKAYCIERKNTVNPQKFIDHYESNGWKVGGKSAMKDWKASVRTWEGNSFNSTQKQAPTNVLKTTHSNTLVEAMQKKANSNK